MKKHIIPAVLGLFSAAIFSVILLVIGSRANDETISVRETLTVAIATVACISLASMFVQLRLFRPTRRALDYEDAVHDLGIKMSIFERELALLRSRDAAAQGQHTEAAQATSRMMTAK